MSNTLVTKKKIKLVIFGSRNITNEKYLLLAFKRSGINIEDIKEIVSGGARGADTLGELFAIKHHLPIIRLLPNWDKHGKKAGIIRNTTMALYSDYGIGIWDGESRGTEHMIKEMKNKCYVLNLKELEDE